MSILNTVYHYLVSQFAIKKIALIHSIATGEML